MKVSPEFAARLRRVAPEQEIPAIVLLQGPQPAEAVTRRLSAEKRKEGAEALRIASAPVLRKIQEILSKMGGKLLAEDVSVLGSLPVKATASGLRAIAALENVRAVMEDQPITLLPRPK